MSEQSCGLEEALELSEQDVTQAMREMDGYLDITPRDFKDIYRKAYALAVRRLSAPRLAREVMTRAVISVGEEDSLWQVASLMAERKVSGVPVLDAEGMVKGIISEKDFLRLMSPDREQSFMAVVACCLGAKDCLVSHLHGKVAREVMSSPPVSVGEDTNSQEIANIFAQRSINRAPVVDGRGRLLGIITRGDLLRLQRGA